MTNCYRSLGKDIIFHCYFFIFKRCNCYFFKIDKGHCYFNNFRWATVTFWNLLGWLLLLFFEVINCYIVFGQMLLFLQREYETVIFYQSSNSWPVINGQLLPLVCNGHRLLLFNVMGNSRQNWSNRWSSYSVLYWASSSQYTLTACMATTRDAVEESYLVLAIVWGKDLLVRRDVLAHPHQDMGI